MIKFIVPSVPVAQPRPRATAINGHARMYEAAKSHPINAFKACVKMAAAAAYDGPPLDGPLSLTAHFILPRPKRLIWKSRPMVRQWHVGKPDQDNLVKGLVDAMNGLLFVDDCQICSANVLKFIASGDEQPHVNVAIGAITD